MATQTTNYHFPKYEADDLPNLLDEYNEFADLADAAINNAMMAATNAGTAAQTAKTAADAASAKVDDVEETVNTISANVVTAQNTADSALSLAQTNEEDLAGTQSDVTALQSSVASLQSGKAPTNHRSASGTYGTGTESEYGHLRVTDTPGTTGASSATAISPAGAKAAAIAVMTPRNVLLSSPSSGAFSGSPNRAQIWDDIHWLRFTFTIMLNGNSNPDYIQIATCDALGIDPPSADREIVAGCYCFKSGGDGTSALSTLHVRANGNVEIEGWNTVGGARVDWSQITSMQTIVDTSSWS